MLIEMRLMDGKLIPFGNAAQRYLNTLPNSSVVKLRTVEESVGSDSMARTWRKWMGEISEHMAGAGVTMPLYIDSTGKHHGQRPFNAKDAHELFTMQFMGADSVGRRYSWAMNPDGGETVAPKSKRLYAMDKLVQWCAERAIPITIPRKGEYADAIRDQEK